MLLRHKVKKFVFVILCCKAHFVFLWGSKSGCGGKNLALWQVWVVGGLGATCQCAKCVSAKKKSCAVGFFIFSVSDGCLSKVCLSRFMWVALLLPLTLRLGDGLEFNVLSARTSADWKTKAEDKYKKPIFVRLLELLLIANYSRLLFLQPAYCQT